MNENLGEKGGLPIMAFSSRAAWSAWLDAHHMDSTGVWLALPKKGGGEAGVSYADALEVALCYGWVDGQKGTLNERFWLQRFTARRPGSIWSRVNRDKALVLIARGAMQPAGLREVERAQADGRWDAAYEPSSTMEVPDDLRAGIGRQPSRGGVLRHARPHEPLRDPASHPYRKETRDADPAHRELRGDAR